MADKQTPPPPPLSGKHPPAITLPPRGGIDMFTGGAGASPGPMTLVSSFFAANDPDTDCRSFSQLLAGGGATSSSSDALPDYSIAAESSRGGRGSFTFQQRGAAGLTASQPPGMSLASFLDSSGFFNPSQGTFGTLNQRIPGNDGSISQSQSENKLQSVYSSLPPAPPNQHQQMVAGPVQELKLLNEPCDTSGFDPKHRTSNLAVDKPTDDGYNWRKYGQKQVKGGDFPRSYYKCTHPSCPVKKKVERSLDGQITEIIYRGQHNHSPPSKRNRDPGNAIEVAANSQGNLGFGSEPQAGNFNKLIEEASSIRDQDQSQVTPERLSGSSDSEEVDDVETKANERNEDVPESKRRIVEAQPAAQASSHRTVTEPRIVVQTTSEVDLLDDGYRWRKYGQKVVKGNPNPRSYYKCSHPGCSIRKHVERAATDPKAVITTYEGKHNHDAPTSKSSSAIKSSRQQIDFK